MTIRRGYYLFFILFSVVGCTQQNTNSSLKELYREARLLSNKNQPEALRIIEAHNTLARINKEKSQLGDGYFLKAWILVNSGDPDNALVSYFNALIQYRDVEDFSKQASILKNIGSIFYEAGSYDVSLTYYRDAIEAATQAEVEKELANIYYNMGLSYKYLGKYDSAGLFYLKSLDIKNETDEIPGQVRVYNEMGIINYELGDFKQARSYYEKVRLIIEEDPDYAVMYSKIINNIGNSYLGEKNYGEAKPWILRGLELMKAANNTNDFPIALNNLGLIYSSEGKEDSAKYYYTNSIAANMDNHNSEEIVVSWDNLKRIFNSMGQMDSAYYYSSLLNEITVPAYKLRGKLERDSQKYRLELLNSEYVNQQIRKVDAQKRIVLALIFIGVIVSLVLAAVTWYFYIKKQGVKESSLLKYLPESLRFRMEILLFENQEYKKTIEEMRKTRLQAQMRVNK